MDKVNYSPSMEIKDEKSYSDICQFLGCVADTETFEEKTNKNLYYVEKGVVRMDAHKRKIELSDMVSPDIVSGIKRILGGDIYAR